jgi:hypothetical protein
MAHMANGKTWVLKRRTAWGRHTGHKLRNQRLNAPKRRDDMRGNKPCQPQALDVQAYRRDPRTKASWGLRGTRRSGSPQAWQGVLGTEL